MQFEISQEPLSHFEKACECFYTSSTQNMRVEAENYMKSFVLGFLSNSHTQSSLSSNQSAFPPPEAVDILLYLFTKSVGKFTVLWAAGNVTMILDTHLSKLTPQTRHNIRDGCVEWLRSRGPYVENYICVPVITALVRVTTLGWRSDSEMHSTPQIILSFLEKGVIIDGVVDAAAQRRRLIAIDTLQRLINDIQRSHPQLPEKPSVRLLMFREQALKPIFSCVLQKLMECHLDIVNWLSIAKDSSNISSISSGHFSKVFETIIATAKKLLDICEDILLFDFMGTRTVSNPEAEISEKDLDTDAEMDETQPLEFPATWAFYRNTVVSSLFWLLVRVGIVFHQMAVDPIPSDFSASSDYLGSSVVGKNTSNALIPGFSLPTLTSPTASSGATSTIGPNESGAGNAIHFNSNHLTYIKFLSTIFRPLLPKILDFLSTSVRITAQLAACDIRELSTTETNAKKALYSRQLTFLMSYLSTSGARERSQFLKAGIVHETCRALLRTHINIDIAPFKSSVSHSVSSYLTSFSFFSWIFLSPHSKPRLSISSMDFLLCAWLLVLAQSSTSSTNSMLCQMVRSAVDPLRSHILSRFLRYGEAFPYTDDLKTYVCSRSRSSIASGGLDTVKENPNYFGVDNSNFNRSKASAGVSGIGDSDIDDSDLDSEDSFSSDDDDIGDVDDSGGFVAHTDEYMMDDTLELCAEVMRFNSHYSILDICGSFDALIAQLHQLDSFDALVISNYSLTSHLKGSKTQQKSRVMKQLGWLLRLGTCISSSALISTPAPPYQVDAESLVFGKLPFHAAFSLQPADLMESGPRQGLLFRFVNLGWVITPDSGGFSVFHGDTNPFLRYVGNSNSSFHGGSQNPFPGRTVESMNPMHTSRSLLSATGSNLKPRRHSFGGLHDSASSSHSDRVAQLTRKKIIASLTRGADLATSMKSDFDMQRKLKFSSASPPPNAGSKDAGSYVTPSSSNMFHFNENNGSNDSLSKAADDSMVDLSIVGPNLSSFSTPTHSHQAAQHQGNAPSTGGSDILFDSDSDSRSDHCLSGISTSADGDSQYVGVGLDFNPAFSGFADSYAALVPGVLREANAVSNFSGLSYSPSPYSSPMRLLSFDAASAAPILGRVFMGHLVPPTTPISVSGPRPVAPVPIVNHQIVLANAMLSQFFFTFEALGALFVPQRSEHIETFIVPSRGPGTGAAGESIFSICLVALPDLDPDLFILNMPAHETFTFEEVEEAAKYGSQASSQPLMDFSSNSFALQAQGSDGFGFGAQQGNGMNHRENLMRMLSTKQSRPEAMLGLFRTMIDFSPHGEAARINMHNYRSRCTVFDVNFLLAIPQLTSHVATFQKRGALAAAVASMVFRLVLYLRPISTNGVSPSAPSGPSTFEQADEWAELDAISDRLRRGLAISDAAAPSSAASAPVGSSLSQQSQAGVSLLNTTEKIWTSGRIALELALANFSTFFHQVYSGNIEAVQRRLRLRREFDRPFWELGASNAVNASMSSAFEMSKNSLSAAKTNFLNQTKASDPSTAMSMTDAFDVMELPPFQALESDSDSEDSSDENADNILLILMSSLRCNNPNELLDLLLAKTLDSLRLTGKNVCPPIVLSSSIKFLRSTTTNSISDLSVLDLLRTRSFAALLKNPETIQCLPSFCEPRNIRMRSMLYEILFRVLFMHAKSVSEPERKILTVDRKLLGLEDSSNMDSIVSGPQGQCDSTLNGNNPFGGGLASGTSMSSYFDNNSKSGKFTGSTAAVSVEPAPSPENGEENLFLFQTTAGISSWFIPFTQPLTSTVAQLRQRLGLSARPQLRSLGASRSSSRPWWEIDEEEEEEDEDDNSAAAILRRAAGTKKDKNMRQLNSSHSLQSVIEEMKLASVLPLPPAFASTVGNPSDASFGSLKFGIISILRDLRGVFSACNSVTEMSLVVDWAVAVGIPALFSRIVAIFSNSAYCTQTQQSVANPFQVLPNHDVLIPLLRVLAEIVNDAVPRTAFAPDKPSGFIIFHLVSSSVCEMARSLLTVTRLHNQLSQGSKLQAQPLDLRKIPSTHWKLVQLCLLTSFRLLCTKIAPVGIMTAMNDAMPLNIWHAVVSLVTSTPADVIIERGKLAVAVALAADASVNCLLPLPLRHVDPRSLGFTDHAAIDLSVYPAFQHRFSDNLSLMHGEGSGNTERFITSIYAHNNPFASRRPDAGGEEEMKNHHSEFENSNLIRTIPYFVSKPVFGVIHSESSVISPHTALRLLQYPTSEVLKFIERLLLSLPPPTPHLWKYASSLLASLDAILALEAESRLLQRNLAQLRVTHPTLALEAEQRQDLIQMPSGLQMTVGAAATVVQAMDAVAGARGNPNHGILGVDLFIHASMFAKGFCKNHGTAQEEDYSLGAIISIILLNLASRPEAFEMAIVSLIELAKPECKDRFSMACDELLHFLKIDHPFKITSAKYKHEFSVRFIAWGKVAAEAL